MQTRGAIKSKDVHESSLAFELLFSDSGTILYGVGEVDLYSKNISKIDACEYELYASGRNVDNHVTGDVGWDQRVGFTCRGTTLQVPSCILGRPGPPTIPDSPALQVFSRKDIRKYRSTLMILLR